ncbi:MAG: DUF1489 domain-containing protein [Pseudomonadota bacterium]|nr:DUF1489 domain-containing protein [Pseudomonadota bacterium]
MTVHLKKLSVGSKSLETLRVWQALRLSETGRLIHVTRNRPRRAAEILNGGSIYWIIRGVISARQNIIDLVEVQRADGQVACGLVLSPDLVATVPAKMRIFQGWRYLETEDAPADMKDPVDESMPPALVVQLRELGVL